MIKVRLHCACGFFRFTIIIYEDSIPIHHPGHGKTVNISRRGIDIMLDLY